MEYRALSGDSWQTYLYEKNLQGDIVAVYSEAGTKLATYTYDAWGNFSTTYTNGGANTPAAKNPFTYRGYYLDRDLGLYYLNSRYYDQNTRRFISPDDSAVLNATPMELTDKNLYAYCDNNPITRADNGGEFWHIIAGAVVGAVVNGVKSAVKQYKTTGKVNWKSVAVSAGTGAASGALAATGVGFLGQAAANTILSGTESILTQGFENGFDNIDYKAVAVDAVIGGLTNAGNGLSKGDAKHLMTQGVAATKQISNKGFIKSAKYYFSQTNTLFYRPLVTDAANDIQNAIISRSVNKGATFWTSFWG